MNVRGKLTKLVDLEGKTLVFSVDVISGLYFIGSADVNVPPKVKQLLIKSEEYGSRNNLRHQFSFND